MDIQTVLDWLKPYFDVGGVIEVSQEAGIYKIDLLTQAKSSCHLHISDHAIIAYRRYDRIDSVESFDDLLRLIIDCGHGRSFFSTAWVKVLNANHYSDPRGIL